ncbi:hypothetical protein F4553_007636 [Allocatelliglobosispora scoriae]|uniref:Uncharacterized protein n=1 Tax=Allocatelliglobosispora scoriae TaxID=643052 RepID=A0A841C554_9ACTN|nr:hypothetical protein [Allocatelliglobosispora scoriae]MBB5874202.1 hypothetical protein [Allocatelliglobosispora scoriae]
MRTAPGTEDGQRLRIEETGESLLVTTGGAHPAAMKVARSLPVERDRLNVVMTDPGLVGHPELAQRLRRWVPGRADSMRLIAPCAASPGPTGTIPAQRLGDLLDCDVIAPVGEFVAVPGGSLFALAGKDAAGSGQWLRFRQGRPPVPAGRRFPAPVWEVELAEFVDPGIPELSIEEIPAGLWVHWARLGGDRPDPNDLAYSSPVEAESVVLLVSRPGDAPLRASDLRRVIEALPAPILERLVVVPYGDDPVSDGALGEVIAAAAGRSVRVRTGLPLHLAGRGQHMVAVGADGRPTWIPFAREVAWRPHGGSRLLAWTAPVEQLLPTGPGQLMLNERWMVEVVEAGLWIREAHRSEGAGAVRRLPLDADRCTVVIGVGDADQIQPPWRAVERLLKQLPPDALARLRLAVPAAAGEWFAVAVTRGCRSVLDGDAPDVLTRSGRLVPWTTASAPVPQHTVQTAPDTAEQPAPSISAPEARRRRSKETELSSLLSFVDQIRRAPAWDELPPEGVAAPGSAAPGAAAQGVAVPGAAAGVPDEEWWQDTAEPRAATARTAEQPAALLPQRAEIHEEK